MSDDNEEYEEVEFEYEEVATYPEEMPQAGVNAWDVLRIASLPLVGFTQGFSTMIEQSYSLIVHMSEQHDAKKAAKEMEKALR